LSAILTSRAGKEIAKRVHPQLRLYVIPAGVAPPNPHELLVRPIFKLVLNQCASQFDVVLIDTPALSDAADALVLSAHAGNALIVARRHHTRHAQLKSTVKKLSQAGVKVVGSVVIGH
jgi:receptor protein-tyrosine kinase